jgi:Zn-dependent M28 family amino/carboxypeptidase
MVLVSTLGGCVSLTMPGRSFKGPAPALTPDEEALRDALRHDVEVLATTIGERRVGRTDKLVETGSYIESELRLAGWEVRRQDYTVRDVPCWNLVAEMAGRRAPGEIVVVGAHYDSEHHTPGADDNASGVAALLSLARNPPEAPDRTLRLVAFTNEEEPWFQTGQMGSMVAARASEEAGENVVAMLSLECLAFYSDAPQSQHYPFPLSLFYPSRGNFLAFVANPPSRKLLRRAGAAFRAAATIPSEGAVLPELVDPITWSDHASYWRAGYPALMLTDTAPLRNPNYHLPTDTPDTLDFDRFTRAVTGIHRVVADLLQAADR